MIVGTCLGLLMLLSQASAPDVEAKVRHHGSLRAMMHEGATGAVVRLDEVVPGPHAFGVGALSGLRGEVTILDDRVWYSYPDGKAQVRTVRGAQPGDESAALLVVADVESWESTRLAAPLDLAGLEEHLTRIAARRSAGGAFPFLIEATFPGLQIHVIDGQRIEPGASHDEHRRSAVTLAPEQVAATLVGFYSDEHQGIFTHHGQRVHVHAVLEAPLATGHVDAAEIPAGAILKLP